MDGDAPATMAAPAETRPTAEQQEEQFAVDDAPLAKAEKKSEGEKAEENHSHPKPESSMGSKKSIAKELKSFNAEGNEPAVKTGKRERRKTEFLAATLASPKKKDDGDDGKKKQGKGVKLREIENVKFALDKVKRDDDILVLLHRLLYKTPGKEQSRKRDVLDFSGFVYEDETKDREKKVVFIEKVFQKPRLQIMDIFDLPRGSGADGAKEAQVGRILKFLEKPCATEGRPSKVELKEKKKAKTTTKRKRASAKKKKVADTKKAASTKASNEVSKLKKQNADLKKKLEVTLQKIEKLTGEKVERDVEEEKEEEDDEDRSSSQQQARRRAYP